jgi:ketopantoate reductase
MVDLDVLVVGGGAIGGVTAALMNGKVRRVMVLDANADHVARLRDPGLRLDRHGRVGRDQPWTGPSCADDACAVRDR